jgi:hypothetical protein
MLNLDLKESGYSGNLNIREKKGWSPGFSYIQVRLYSHLNYIAYTLQDIRKKKLMKTHDKWERAFAQFLCYPRFE